jgi:hypothetical protein
MAGRVRVREVTDDEGNRLKGIVRRGIGSVVTWRRAQMVLWSAQGMSVPQIARQALPARTGSAACCTTSTPMASRRCIRGMPAGIRRCSRWPSGGRSRRSPSLPPADHGLPFSRWSLAKLGDLLVAEGVVEDISHEGLRTLLRARMSGFKP